MIKVISVDFKLKDKFISFVANRINIDSIILNRDVIYKNNYINVKLMGYTFKVSNESFFQINTEQTEKLYSKIIDYIDKCNTSIALDLYCGVGTITALLSKHYNKVIGIEVIKEAVDNAKENMMINEIANVSFIQDKVENKLNTLRDMNIDLIVLDPPRAGIDIKALNSLIELKPKQIIYVSCNPETLARDVKLLSELYKINEISPFDMFPNTHHVECVVSLSINKNNL